MTRGRGFKMGMTARVCIALSAALLVPQGPAGAANEDTCEKVAALLWAVDEVAAEWPDSDRVSKMALTRLSMKAMAALGAADRAAAADRLPEEMVTGIAMIRDGIASDTGKLQADPQAMRPELLSGAETIVNGMPDACPDVDLPALSADRN